MATESESEQAGHEVVPLPLRTIAMSNQNIEEVDAIPLFFHYMPTDI